jgi:2-keto-3-deoxy-L-rhamnonate aldolase RhmA
LTTVVGADYADPSDGSERKRMDKIEQIQRLLTNARAGREPTGIMTAQPSSQLLEMTLTRGFEWVLIDQEHSTVATPGDLVHLMQVADAANVPSIVKLAAFSPVAARDAFDVGACGIQVPFVSSGDQLREVIAACRFPPSGKRGFCPISRSTQYQMSDEIMARHMALQNEHILIIPVIETEAAVENLDAMLAEFPECPIFSIGPEDLRLSMGLEFNDEDTSHMVKVVRAIAKKIRAAGKLNMLPVYGPSTIKSSDDVAESIGFFYNDLPYFSDGNCLLYGASVAIEIRDKSRQKRAPK